MNAPLAHPPKADALPSSEGVTPVMAQFLAAKASQPDAIVFFRMGDFYELFFKDAEIAAAALGITLTKRGKHQGEDIPMAGVPVHAMDGYLARLIRMGFKVAICEQLENPAEAKKRGSKAVVHRGVVRVVTPGLCLEPDALDARTNNYLVAVTTEAGEIGLAALELSTAELRACRVGDTASLLAELVRLDPREILLAGGHPVAAVGAEAHRQQGERDEQGDDDQEFHRSSLRC